MKTIVSVCIAARNEEHTIRDSVLSAEAACCSRPHEIIVCANACTDRTEDVLRGVAREVTSLRVLRTERPGKANAWNMLRDAATGDLLIFMDADVIVHPESIAQLLARLEEDPCLIGVAASGVPVCQHADWLSLLLLRRCDLPGCLTGRLYAVRAAGLASRMRACGFSRMDDRLIAEDYWVTLVVGARRWAAVDYALVYYAHPHWTEAREIELRNSCGVRQIAHLYPKLARFRTESVRARLTRHARMALGAGGPGAAARLVAGFGLRVVWRRKAARLTRAAARDDRWEELWRTAASTKRGLSNLRSLPGVQM